MSGYFSGSNAEADAMQTLYLMNPSYTGFNESSNLGNMVLINPSGAAAHQQGNRFDNLGHTHHHHHQQQHGGFSPASTITPTAIASMNHQNSSPASIFTGRVAEQGYGWNGGNTFSVLSSPDMAEDGHSLAARLGAMNSVHQPASDLSRFGMRSLSQPPIHQQEPLIPNGVALDVESLHASGSAGQILSLSLSPQVAQLQSLPLQHPEAGVNDCSGFSNIGSDSHLGKGESFSMGDGILGSFRAPSRDNILHPGLQTSVGNSRQVSNMVSSASPIELYRSKYLKATQQLLDEVVSVGRGTKNSGSNTKVSSWKGPSAANSEGFLTKENSLMEISGKDRAAASWTCAKEAGPSTSSAPESTAGIPEHNSDSIVELTLAERHDLQMKKTKLMGMLDDVDRRYRQYYHQMQGVVGSFESAAGLGAARTYTTLALQTISKHFRCLKDAIRIQIRTTCRSLGEEDASGQKRGETSRLRFIDQQLRQQRAFQQLGMMQQPAWRPQRGLPERAVTILRAWLFEHFLHPYPKDSDKHMLARQTGLTRNQVSNWFINARVRLWKPMVEEMYAEEIKDEGDGEEAHQRGEGEETSRAGSGPMDGGNNEAIIARSKLHDANLDQYSDPKAMSGNSSDMLQSKSLTGNLSESFLFQERGGMSQGVKRARNAAQDSSPLLSSYSSAHVEFKPGQEIHDVKVRMDERHVDNYSMPHGEVAQLNDQNLGGYGSLSLMGLSRYPHEGLASNYAANSGVSLTLGLQHSDGLSLSGAESGAPQQHYMQGMGQVRMLRRDDDGIAPVNYYGMNENVAGPNSGYVTLDTKRYGNHLLHDFT